MSNKKKINKNTIEKIILTDFEEQDWYVYKKEIKFFGIIFREEGLYNFMNHKVSPSHCIFKDNKVLNKPCVNIRFVSKYEQNHYFDTFAEAKDFYQKIASDVNFYEY